MPCSITGPLHFHYSFSLAATARNQGTTFTTKGSTQTNQQSYSRHVLRQGSFAVERRRFPNRTIRGDSDGSPSRDGGAPAAGEGLGGRAKPPPRGAEKVHVRDADPPKLPQAQMQ